VKVKFRLIRNFVGNLKGVSGCMVCGDRWNWKKEHDIANFGAFPFCEECWQRYRKSSPDKLVQGAERLATIWMRDTSFSHRAETEEHALQMFVALKAELESGAKNEGTEEKTQTKTAT